MSNTATPLLDALTLTAEGDDTFVGHHQVPSGRAYGGELVAQAQVAMARRDS